MSTLLCSYIQGLLNSYNDSDKEHFKLINPASNEKIDLLRSLYPNIPSELIGLLNIVNGSKFTVTGYCSSLDFFQLYPDTDDGTRYEFCTIDEMLKHKAGGDYSWLSLFSEETSDWDEEDLQEIFSDEVNPHALVRERILFAENDYSQLYIDFNPSEHGKIGQIVAYMHDPESYFQIAESFSDFMQSHIDSNFQCFNYEEIEEDEEPESIYVSQTKINDLNEYINSVNSILIDVSSLTVSTQRHSFPRGGLEKIFSVIPRSITSLKLELKRDDFVELADVITTLPVGIESLDLSGNSMGWEVDGSLLAKIFANIPPHVSSLNLYDNFLCHLEGDELALAFESLPQKIVLLDLGYNYLGGYCCNKLKKIFKAIPQSVTSLNLRNNLFDKRPGNELAYVFSIIPENVRILSLRTNSLNSRLETGLDEALKSIPATITQIDLKWNGLKAEDYPSSPTRIFLF